MTLFPSEESPAAQREVLCGRCRQPLTRRQSRELGFGDDCAEILGILAPPAPWIPARAGGSVEGQEDLLAEGET